VSPRGRGHLDPADGIGDAGLNDMTAAGFERAVSAFDLDTEVRLGELETNEFEEELRRL
jgi:hypothetical protein